MALIYILYFIFIFHKYQANVFSFEIKDNKNFCLYDDLKKNVNSTVDYQVINGGAYDIDVQMKNPYGTLFYEKNKYQFDSFEFSAENDGTYEICFSNEHSSKSPKEIFFEWERSDEDNFGIDDTQKPLTFIESKMESIHHILNQIEEVQNHFRSSEITSKLFKDYLNAKVTTWSLLVLFSIVFIGIGQVLILQSFFSNKPSSTSSRPIKSSLLLGH